MENPEAFTQESFKRMSLSLQTLTPQVNDLSVGISNIVALVGATGVGKSTLTAYLKDAKLTFDKYGGGKYQINHVNIGTDLPKIGHQNQSCTTLPGVYKDEDKAYVDLAGWFDTRAPQQEILNSISNSLIFTPSKRVKILIVIQVQELNALRGGLLVQIANRLIQFFEEDFSKMINSIILVISKVNTLQWDLKDIENNIKKICQKNQNLKHHTKFQLQFQLIQSNNTIIYFKIIILIFLIIFEYQLILIINFFSIKQHNITQKLNYHSIIIKLKLKLKINNQQLFLLLFSLISQLSFFLIYYLNQLNRQFYHIPLLDFSRARRVNGIRMINEQIIESWHRITK